MSMRKRKKVQILSREELRLRRWDFRLVPSERGLEAVGKSVHLHIISRDNHIDLFPHTSAVEKNGYFEVKKAIDIFPRTNGSIRRIIDINLEQSSHVECVCCLSNRGPDANGIYNKVAG